MRIVATVLALVGLPWVLDALLRWAAAAFAGRQPHWVLETWKGLVVLVPARGEGDRVLPTLSSILAARRERNVQVVLVLDGPDPVAERIASELGGIQVSCKPNPGPSKGAVLQFAAEELKPLLEACDGVMVVDVGSRLSPDFFDHLLLPKGVDAVQTFLAGEGNGPGQAAGLSERLAQSVWDMGRQNLGFSVRLRGTGTIFRPKAFLQVVPELQTQVEDTEASLLIASQGGRTALLPAPALVRDQKPETTQEASQQRARWLRGQGQIIRAHWRRLVALTLRRPWEGLGWFLFLVSRPLSFTTPLRLLTGLSLFALAFSQNWHLLALWGAVTAATALLELGWLVVTHPRLVGSAMLLALAWVRALPQLAKAGKRWYQGRGGK